MERSTPFLTPVIPTASVTPIHAPELSGSTPSTPPQNLHWHVPSPTAALALIRREIIGDLETNITKLLTLNPSRRKAIWAYLHERAGHSPPPRVLAGDTDGKAELRGWIHGPHSEAHRESLQSYFEEIALITLGQAVLLKGWCLRGIRNLKERDLADLNFALNEALKPHLPLHREGWQLTRQNIYSWYKLTPSVQQTLWKSLQMISPDSSAEDPILGLLQILLKPVTLSFTESKTKTFFDTRFFQSLWNHLPDYGFSKTADCGPLKRVRYGYSPTLGDGRITRTCPYDLTWVGTERSPFCVMSAELMRLTSGPQPPPLWSMGSGLETHSRDQLQLQLSTSAIKPSLVQQIAELEACDLAFVQEDKCLRMHSKTAEAASLREQLDQLSYFKQFRSAQASLSAYQAMVALTKLRPGGFLVWARQEPLGLNDGASFLEFFLERGRILCEWDFSELSHNLPGTGETQPFPRFLYLVCRENDMQILTHHRPFRIAIQGQVRSHVELPLLLDDALKSAAQPISSPDWTLLARGPWRIRKYQSPSPQWEWRERWPEPASHAEFARVEALKESSRPLGQIATVRAGIIGETQALGLIVSSESGPPRRLIVQKLQSHSGRNDQFVVLLEQKHWVTPLSQYLQSDIVKQWLDLHAERKAGRWCLSEQILKWLPVPEALISELENLPMKAIVTEGLSTRWQKVESLIEQGETGCRQLGSALAEFEPLSPQLKARIFVKACLKLEELETQHKALLQTSQLGSQKISMKQVLELIPETDRVRITLHPQITITRPIPLNVPIIKIEKLKTPQLSLVCVTDSGLFCHIQTDTSELIELLTEQLQGVSHPTWAELIDYLRIPRRIDVFRALYDELQTSYTQVTAYMRALEGIISHCGIA